VVTSLLSAGEAVAYYLLRHVVGFLNIPGNDVQSSYYEAFCISLSTCSARCGAASSA
jgi:hypothetical protein